MKIAWSDAGKKTEDHATHLLKVNRYQSPCRSIKFL